MFVVEIITHGASLIDEMTAMRLWLDHQQFEPASFRHIIDGCRVVFRVDFTVEAEAIGLQRLSGARSLRKGSRSEALSAIQCRH